MEGVGHRIVAIKLSLVHMITPLLVPVLFLSTACSRPPNGNAVIPAATVSGPISGEFKAWVVAKLPDTPDGLGIDSKGNIYTTLFHSDEVVVLKDDGSYDHVAWVPSKEESGKGRLAGLDLDKADNIYVAYKGGSNSLREISNDVPDHLFGYAISPDAPGFIDRPEQTTGFRT